MDRYQALAWVICDFHLELSTIRRVMSGEIFQREPDPIPENLEEVDVIGRNPLMCYLCNGKYDDPCILGCYHSFCSACLGGRAMDGKMLCPLCKESTALKEGESLPSKDKLLQFLVMSSNEEREQCANCDEQEEGQMFFCNTCAQPLCERCREETHRAKMFTRHDIVVLSKRTKEIHRECSLHNEPFILFSIEKKMMLCINCFRDMKIESRSYCVDMETAYHQSCKKLDQRMQAIRDLQNSVQDSILLLRALLEEITQNSELEKSAIKELYDSMLKEITDKKETLLTEVDRQYQDKQKLFTEELASLSTLLPTLHTHLVTSAAFSSSANKFEFLDLAYILMERLKSIIHLQYPLHPSQGSQIYTDFKSQIAKCLEPLLFPQRMSTILSASAAGSLSLSSSGSTAPRLEKKLSVPQVRSGNLSQNERRQVALNKLKLTEGKGVFADHCQDFDNSHKGLSQMVERMKSHLQELQRDLTLRRCLTKQTVMEELQAKVEQVEQQLEDHKTKMEQKQPVLEKYWEECVQRMTCEQEVYQAQLQDVMRIHQETSHLRTILNQLSRFVTSITALTERLAPKLATSTKESNHDNQIAAIFEQINIIEPDSQHRVEALRSAEEERETISANRTNPMDEELIKTKGLLKAPSARRDGNQRRDLTKRESKDAKGESTEKNPAPSLSKDSTLIEYLTELETGAKVSLGDVSKVVAINSVVTGPPCEDSVSAEIPVNVLKEVSVEVAPKSEVKGEFDFSKVLDEICNPDKETVSNTESKEDVEESASCVDTSLEVVLPLEPGTPATESNSPHLKPYSKEDTIPLAGNDGTNGRPLSPKINLLTDDEPAVNISGDKLGLKPSSSSKEVFCDTLSITFLPEGHHSPGGQSFTSPTPSDSSISGIGSPNSDTQLCLPLSTGLDSQLCGPGSPVSDTQMCGAGSPGDMSEVEGQEDDMTGGETLRARIERLKGSIDNGTSVSQLSKSPQDSVVQGPLAPQDNVSQRSRSPRNKCSVSNGVSPVVDVGKVCVSSCVSNGDVLQKGDSVSRSVDVTKQTGPCEPDLKSLTQGRTVSQASGRRRRRVKADQVGNPVRTRDVNLGSEHNEQASEVKCQKK
ncbi:RING finger protein 207-like [Mizuhopecten yessoensis]|uniref:RING finger protein 207 n=1 Tax=Mizuhopecten yessoensis TaxID=6573 RepID=A0A210QTN5_MIZYE|nr:RING finger protein 207-like [Mizuhopecten yessoensis]XP_021350099.1 RING finger protein 207-like [Mizuhopecten yessoensis]OWF52070.1 RING finger protein 207 [Mizuhopecten yessoensis]